MGFRLLCPKNPWRLRDIIWSKLFEVTNFFEQGSLFCGFLMFENLFWLLDPLCLLTGQSLGDQCYSHSQTTSKPNKVVQHKKTTKERTLVKEVNHLK